MAPSSLKKLGAAIAFASAGRVAAHSPDLLGGVVDAIFGGEEPTPTHIHTTSYVTGTSTSVNEAGETTVVVVVGTTICPVTASEAAESSTPPTETNPVPVPVLTTATSETAAVAVTPSLSASGSGIGSTSLLQNSTVPMTTSTIFTTHSSTITACPTAKSDCTVGDVTTVVVALSTTVCPVTATEGPSNSTVRPTASGNVPGFGTSRTGAQGATTLTASASRASSVFISSKTASGTGSSSVRAQSTITSPSVVLTTVSASTTTTSSGADESSVLEMATGSPSDYSAVYTDATETVAVPTDAAATPTTTNYNDALMSLASSVQASSAEQTGSGCQGMDCIVVQSNSGVKSKMNASGFALVALAGAVFLL